MSERPIIVNELALRYPSIPMLNYWTPESKIIAERQLWIAILKAQQELGMPVPSEAIEAYENVLYDIDFESIRRLEIELRQDVMARIAEFNRLAGYELIHDGMTSRDLTENVEQMQCLLSLKLVEGKVASTMYRLAALAEAHRERTMAGRTHNVPGQIITLGKRFSNVLEEMHMHFLRLQQFIQSYPLRGIKGAMGTQQDMLDRFGGDAEKVKRLEQAVMIHLGFSNKFISVGQTYPRSLDQTTVALLTQVAEPAGNLAITIRLMAGAELMTEGFQDGQAGSTAMPHKMNARTCERIFALLALLQSKVDAISRIAGQQWGEGDVSCSVIRRDVLSNTFFIMDGLLEAFMTVLDDLGAYPAMLDREIERYLPFLASSKILTAARKCDMGREVAHAIIKKHATAAALSMRESGIDKNPFLQNLGGDPTFPLAEDGLRALIGKPLDFAGLANQQVLDVTKMVQPVLGQYPSEVLEYSPEPIL